MLRHGVADGVATITIAHPPANVLTIAMLREMADAIHAAARAKVILFAAEGSMFSAGVDVGQHREPHAAEMIGSFRAVFDALMSFDGIAVAAVDGAALGGGCELACLCDVVIASDRAEFGQPESQVGVLPPVASVLWTRAFGYGRAVDLLLTGSRVSARAMQDAGLVSRVVPHEQFDAAVSEAVEHYRLMSRVVASHVKRACRIGAGEIGAALKQIEALYLNSLMKSKDADEGLRAFLEKRAPRWKDQ
ncbi:MAG TPA: enoyl-CoA hydratase/isomerase family protein [Candidatus Krumholzibacteria bacterium]|nr:enoyl-CoA hydratase/isomerase family protein [Candidatus Krumholzibacteria bacterium]